MTPAETAAILRQFNEWRRGDYEPSEQPEPPDPCKISEAIDAAVEIIDRLEAAEKERDALRAELTDLRNSMTFRTSLIGRIEAEREDLHALIAAVKKQVNAEFRLRMKKEIECNALLARIEAMEKQEPVAWMSSRNGFICKDNKNTDYNMPLYLAPGAKGEDK